MVRKIILGSAGVLLLTVVILRLFFWDRAKAAFYIHDMERPERVARLQVERVMDVLTPEPGAAAADIGAGSGLFSRALARRVGPGGVVYAIDTNPLLLDHIGKTAKREGLPNIQTVRAEEIDPKIPGPVDLIFICDTLHYIEDKTAYLGLIRRCLRPDGKLAIIDLKEDWPPFHDRYKFTADDLKLWTARAGFRLGAEYDFLSREFFMVFEPRPGD